MNINALSRHPRVLPFLFLTEMWERLGFYVAQGLLVLYMTHYYGFSDDLSYTISGTFGGLVYISPFIGGFLADKYLGYQTAILWGGLFLVCGYSLLGLSYVPILFYPALATIIVGNGLLKPNISSLLGTQYEEDDPRRESGFTIFYVGINLGSFLSGFSGYVKEAFGWHTTFILASAGMIIGLLTFTKGLRYIKNSQTFPHLPLRQQLKFIFFCILAIYPLSLLLKLNGLSSWLLPCTGIILLVFLFRLTMKQTPEYRHRMVGLCILIISSIVFWMLFLQQFNSVNLYIDRFVDKHIFGLRLTTTVFYASEALFIIILGPLFALLWQFLASINRNPAPTAKFTLGIGCAGLGFFILSLSAYFPNAAGEIPALWIFTAYLIITIGELCLSPIGLSAVTQLAPPHLIGMMMGIWFVATGFGGIFAGLIAKLASVPQASATLAEKLMIYHAAFLHFAILGLVMAGVLFLVHLSLRRFV